MKKKWILLSVILIWFLYFYRKPIGELIMGLYDDLYKKWAELRGLDWKLLRAVAQTESTENPNAIGDDGRSLGLMQVQLLIGKAYAGIIDISELFDPDKNIEAGSGYLKEMIDKYGLEGGIEAYNLGETKYRKGLRSPTYRIKVLANYEKLGGVLA